MVLGSGDVLLVTGRGDYRRRIIQSTLDRARHCTRRPRGVIYVGEPARRTAGIVKGTGGSQISAALSK